MKALGIILIILGLANPAMSGLILAGIVIIVLSTLT